ncbi:MAG: fatty acid--CoA ligase [Deltaproteobacteria bacterium]
MLLGDLLAHQARVNPNRTAFSDEGTEISYARFAKEAERYAAALRGLGLRRGDRVAILSRSSLAYAELLFAVPGAGGIALPLNPLLIPRELSERLSRSRARIFLYAPEFEETVAAMASILAGEIAVRCLGSSGGGFPPFPGDPLPPGPESSPLPVDRSDPGRDTALMVFSGGSTGRPSPAMLSHRNLLSASASAAIELRLSRNDRFLSCTPLPFIAGTGRLLRFLYVGATILLRNRFDPEEVLETIGRHRVTHLLLTPAMMAQILSVPGGERHDLSSLRAVIYGGAAIPLDLLRRAVAFFRCGMVRSHGQIESAGVLTFLHPEDHSLDESLSARRKLSSIGREAVGVEIRVVDGEGRPVGPDGVGEVVARGENIFQGYFEDPETTAETLRGEWLRTGEVASIDEEGYLTPVDRLRDALTVDGFPVSPREIESILAEHPAVAEAAVLGRPEYLLGEVPVAFVSLREGAHAGVEDLREHCRRNMAPFKVPREIVVTPKLPKNSAGKVLKAKLRNRMRTTPRTPPR